MSSVFVGVIERTYIYAYYYCSFVQVSTAMDVYYVYSPLRMEEYNMVLCNHTCRLFTAKSDFIAVYVYCDWVR